MSAPSIAEPYPCFLDCEASSLSEASYPIEVAWNDPDGTIHNLLINPQSLPAWTDWSAESQAVHGLSRDYLQEAGVSAQAAAEQLREALHGATVVSDAAWWDARWLRRLFMDAQVRAPALSLADADDIWVDRLIAAGAQRESARQTLGRIHLRLKSDYPQRHRAAADVRYLMAVWEAVCATPSRRHPRKRPVQ
ncbi:MAG: hypothetical protein EA402_14340 [Planctomycetota bacterium]|nr:MAG: hypothetical protein EA402_14340 [Planctomycetota bacterium]